jgi:hypothetical protein
MNDKNLSSALILGALLCLGLVALGYFIGHGIVNLRALERTVTVKGLAERDVAADLAIWPIAFNEADNDLGKIADTLQQKNAVVIGFLKQNGFPETDLSLSAPVITDRLAQQFEAGNGVRFRYSAKSTITVYSKDVDRVRQTAEKLVELGKQGIAIGGDDYQGKTAFLFTRLNELKPAMIEEATTNARAVAEKFAADSKSRLGKIKSASQGLFAIEDRDSGTPYIKKVRVVSTVEYYLSD